LRVDVRHQAAGDSFDVGDAIGEVVKRGDVAVTDVGVLDGKRRGVGVAARHERA
jgi:hypothetical protein